MTPQRRLAALMAARQKAKEESPSQVLYYDPAVPGDGDRVAWEFYEQHPNLTVILLPVGSDCRLKARCDP